MKTRKAEDLQVGDKFSRIDADKYVFEIVGIIHKSNKSVRFSANRLQPNPYGGVLIGFRNGTIVNIK